MNVLTPPRGLALAAALARRLRRADVPAGLAGPIERVRHVVVIFAENHSFDNLYGLFPAPTAWPTPPPSRPRSSTTTASRSRS